MCRFAGSQSIGGWLEDLGRAHLAWRAVLLVVLPDKRHRVRADHLGDRPDVTAGVEVAAAGREVALLDRGDDRLPDPGLPAYLGQGETGLTSRLRQGVTDAHVAPPEDLVLWFLFTQRT
jgi:hypothetical protein